MTEKTIGFIGTGAIAAAMVEGLLGHPPAVAEIVVSPRNADVSQSLAERFPAVRIAPDNQGVIDCTDFAVLSVRPQVAEDVVRALRFRSGMLIVSVIAATDRRRLLEWIDAEVTLVQAIPLPFVARRQGVTAIYPSDNRAAALFGALGTAVPCETREEYDLLAAASALMTTYFGILDGAVSWLRDRGLAEEKAKAYLAPLFVELAQTALRAEKASFVDLGKEFATRGGLNEQVFADFERDGGVRALADALDQVLARIRVGASV